MDGTNEFYAYSLAQIDSMDRLCDIARPFIQKKAQRLVGRSGFAPTDQPDIEQEAYLRLIQRFEEAQKVASLPVLFFIKRIVDQSIANQIRRQRAQLRDYRRTTSIHRKAVSGYDDDCCGFGDSGPAEPCDLWWTKLELADVKDAVAKLNQDDRELCVKLGIITVAEIARSTRVPRSTVQSRVSSLRSKLKEYQWSGGI